MESVDSRDEEAPLVADSLQVLTPKNYTRGELGNDFAWDIVHVVHVFLSSCFIGGSSVGFEERSDPWDYWVLAIRGCQFVPFVGTYLTSAALSHASNHKLHEGTVIGSFNGEFWGMFASHQGGSTSGTTLLFIVFLGVITLGTILMCFLRKEEDKGEKETADASVNFYSYLVSLLKSITTLLADVRMLLIIPLFAYSGLQQAFVWAEFTKEIVTPALGVSGVGGAMAVYGAFDAICSLAAGRLTTGLPSITFIVSGGAIAQVVVFLWILINYRVTSGVLGTLYPLIMAALLGIGDGVLNTQLSALLGILFKHDTEGAFAQLKVWQCASIAVVFFIGPYISLQAMLIVMVVGICVSLVGILFLTIQVEKAFYSPRS
ncbi:UNC93-like protein 3 [Citrus sinensis]|nr:UNC93-like protein 3 [Citrus sinensis]